MTGTLSADIVCRFNEGSRTGEGVALETYWQLRNVTFEPDAPVDPELPACRATFVLRNGSFVPVRVVARQRWQRAS